jgi:hypothetical protein
MQKNLRDFFVSFFAGKEKQVILWIQVNSKQYNILFLVDNALLIHKNTQQDIKTLSRPGEK